jgi:hypothetical protein
LRMFAQHLPFLPKYVLPEGMPEQRHKPSAPRALGFSATITGV